MFGAKKLNKAEKKHLREMKLTTLEKFKKQIQFLKEDRVKHPDQQYLCYECIHIAKKLGLWGEE